VCRNIFISPDLTPAEAKALYEVRCARRSRHTDRRIDRTYGASVDVSAYQTSLSASAVPFVPTSSTSSRAEQASLGSASLSLEIISCIV